jgi:TolB-like protein/class 3 adenylate cyclase/cytochrome c-type biogenesis protein CcmH/NrfG
VPTQQSGVRLEIGHVLFIDIVGYSKLLITEQSKLLNELTTAITGTEQFHIAEAEGKLIRLPTGDGMALVFRNDPEAPAQCALELSLRLKSHPELHVRMGIHSGPVKEVTDVNQKTNVTGAGINIAKRVMDCGDAGHILLSKHAADDLEQYPEWREHLHDLGPILVKHELKLDIVSFHNGEVGNADLPEKFKETARASRLVVTRKRRRIFVGLAALVAIALATGLWIFRSSRQIPVLPISGKSIAVLPLENLSEEKANAYFADGVQDELLSNLSKVKDLKVISRTSVMQYKAGITRSLKEIAQQLGVANVVEGSVRRSGDHVRVSVQLIDASTDRHIWSQNYDRTIADSLALQGELATEIAFAIGATLTPQEKARVEAVSTKNTAAYQAYLRGRALLNALTADDSNVEEAPRSFQEAVALDPGFALAWVYLSCADSLAYWGGIDPTPARLTAAKNAMDHAMALDPNLPETHLAIGYYRYYGLRDFSGALTEFQLAEKSLPNNVDVLEAIGLIERRFGRWDEAIAVLRRVVELDPRNVQSASILGITYMAKRRFADAIAVADHMFAVEPSSTRAIWIKTSSLWALGKPEAADAVLANPGVHVHLLAHAALNKRQYPEAADLFLKALNSTRRVDEKNELLLDLGLTQQRAGNVAASRAAYEQAAQQLTQELSAVSKHSGPEATIHSLLGVAYAGLGNAAAAVSEGRKGIALQLTSEDPFEGPEREEHMAQIYALLGNADEAIPILKRWVQVPSVTSITPALLRIDPIWDPIRSDPRFQELVAEKNPHL